MLGLRVVHMFEHGVKKELIFLLVFFIVMVCIIKDLKRQTLFSVDFLRLFRI